MSTDYESFKNYCDLNKIEPSENSWNLWKAAIESQYQQTPTCYGFFDKDGALLQLVDTYIPNLRSNPTPLYSKPQTAFVSKPNLKKEEIEYIWKKYYAEDNDIIGMVKWVERYSKDFKD